MKPCPAVLDLQVLPLDPAGLAEPLAKRGKLHGVRLGVAAVEVANHRHRLLLCPEGVRHQGAAQQEQKLPSSHSRTLMIGSLSLAFSLHEPSKASHGSSSLEARIERSFQRSPSPDAHRWSENSEEPAERIRAAGCGRRDGRYH